MMLSFQNEPDNKLFFLGALVGAVKAGAARAGAVRAGAARARPMISHRPPTATPVKLSINPSSQKTENNTTTNDHSTNSTIVNNK